MSIGNGGVSIGVNANTQQAQRQIAGLGQGLGKLAGTAKNLFGSGTAQQLNSYNKHLNQLERNLDRVNQRLKTLQGVQSNLLQQQRQLQTSGGPGGAAQLATVQKALQQNQRSLSFWQAKQMGGQAAVQAAQANAPRGGIGGGGGGIAGWATGQFTQLAGGIGGGLLKAVGFGALVKGAADIAAKTFMTAADEQKLLADLLPRMRLGEDLAKTSSPKGLMNNFRDMSMPLGYSGIEAMKVASAISPASNGRGGLIRDTQTAMQMARMFGIDAGGQASMLAEGGKMGGFVPGQAKKFAEMLAREISVSGLGPRAQEVQEATLMLMHRQLATSPTASPATAMAEQSILAKTGLPGFQGAQGAGILSNFQSAVTGANSDADISFLEATARDQMGITGYYNMRRLRDQGPLGNPKLFAGYFQEAQKLAPTPDAAKDIMSRVGGMSFMQSEQLYNATHGFKDLNERNVLAKVKGIKGAGGMVDAGAANAMSMTGNQVRQGEATLSGVLARIGTPLVQNTAALVARASTEITHLLHIADSSHNTAEAMMKLEQHFEGGVKGMYPGFTTTQELQERADAQKQYGTNPPRIDVQTGQPITGFGVPQAGGRGPTAAQINALRKSLGPPVLANPLGLPPADPHKLGAVIRRGSADNEMHLHVHFDHSGAIHPHVKTAFIGMVGEALEHLQRTQTRGGLHHRYARA